MEAREAQELEEGPGGWSSDSLNLEPELTATGLAWLSQCLALGGEIAGVFIFILLSVFSYF